MKIIRNKIANRGESTRNKFFRHYVVIYRDKNSNETYMAVIQSTSKASVHEKSKVYVPTKFTNYVIEIYELDARTHVESRVILEGNRGYMYVDD